MLIDISKTAKGYASVSMSSTANVTAVGCLTRRIFHRSLFLLLWGIFVLVVGLVVWFGLGWVFSPQISSADLTWRLWNKTVPLPVSLEPPGSPWSRN